MELELAASETAQYYSRSNVGGLEFIEATFLTHRFARHSHDYYAIGVIDRGVQKFTSRGGKNVTPTGGVFLLNPDEPHDGESATNWGFSYRTFYPTTELLQNLVGEITGKAPTAPFFTPLIVTEPAVTQSLLKLHSTLATSHSSLEAQTRLLDTFALLISRYADRRYKPNAPGQEDRALRQVREYLQAHYAENPSLNELARLVSLSPYYLSRVFKQAFGLPPHAYLESIRIRQAQKLLLQNYSLTEVALETGFFDISHLHKRFKQLLGVSPQQYLQQRKILQEFPA